MATGTQPDAGQILNSLINSILLIDDNLAIHYANPAAQQLLAQSSRKLFGTPLPELLSYFSLNIELMQESLEAGQGFTDNEVTLVIDGRSHILSVTAQRMPDGMILLEMAPMDNQRRLSQEQLQHAQQVAARDLVRGLAHEIKNPLGGLRGAAQLLSKALPDPSLLEYTKVIIEQADRLRNLVDRLLGPQLPGTRVTESIHKVAERVVALVSMELPENVSFREAAMLEPLSVALHAVKRSGVKPGDTAAVIGTGMIGFAAAAWAKALGAETVFVIGRGEAKRAIAEQIPGISYVTEEESKAIQADVVVEAVGTPQAVSGAVLLARPGGSIVLMGNPSGDLAMEKNVYWRILRKQLNLMGTWNSSYEKDEACDWTEALDALSKKKIPAQALITHCFPSEKLMDGLELMKNHKEPYCKVMVSWE